MPHSVSYSQFDAQVALQWIQTNVFCSVTSEIKIWVYSYRGEYTLALYLKAWFLQDKMHVPKTMQKDIRSRAFSCLQNLLCVLCINEALLLTYWCFSLVVYKIQNKCYLQNRQTEHCLLLFLMSSFHVTYGLFPRWEGTSEDIALKCAPCVQRVNPFMLGFEKA